MKLIRTLGMVPLLLGSLAVFSLPAVAGPLITGYTPAPGTSNPANSLYGLPCVPAAPCGDTLGFSFIADSDMTITHLGTIADPNYTVDGSDPLDSDHLVGLWHSDGTKLAEVTVAANADINNAQDGFFYTALGVAVDLQQGVSYTIGALYSALDGDAFWRTNAVSLSGISGAAGVGTSAANLGFVMPTTSFGIPPLVGPNAIAVRQTPEPGTVMLLGLGLLGFGLSRRRR